MQNSDESSILGIVKKVIQSNDKIIEEYKSGKTKVLGFLIGQVMKETRGKANPRIANELMIRELSNLMKY